MAQPGEILDKYFVAYIKCDGVQAALPFGIFDFDTYILYLDNNPTDGRIDEIVSEPQGDVYEDAPDCNEGK